MMRIDSNMINKERAFIFLIILKFNIYSGLSETFTETNTSSSLIATN